jgi:hypothetical protein
MRASTASLCSSSLHEENNVTYSFFFFCDNITVACCFCVG